MTNDIIRHDGNGAMTLADTMTLAEHFARSGYFRDVTDVSKAVVKIMAGRELGIPDMAAMTGINIVEGKPALSAGLVGALVLRSGRYTYRVLESTDTACRIAWQRDGVDVGESAFTIEDAKRAKLQFTSASGKPTGWTKYPSDMCFARAMTRGARRFCPDVFIGAIYTPEELGASVDRETGEVIDVTPVRPDNGHGAAVTQPIEWTPDALPVHEHVDTPPEDVADRTTPPDPEPDNLQDVHVRNLCEAAIRDKDVAALPAILDIVKALPDGFHKAGARKWYALARVLVDPTSLTPVERRTARPLIGSMPDDTPGKSQAIDILEAAA